MQFFRRLRDFLRRLWRAVKRRLIPTKARKKARSTTKTEANKATSEIQGPVSRPDPDLLLDEYMVDGDYEAFRSRVGAALVGGTISRRAVATFIKEALDSGRPEDVVSILPSLPQQLTLYSRTRQGVFSALLLTNDTRAAHIFAMETLATRSIDKAGALALVADAHLASPQLTQQAARYLAGSFRQDMTAAECIFVANVVLIRCGADAMLDLGLPHSVKGARLQDMAIFRSNLARSYGKFAEQVSLINEALAADGLRPVARCSDTEAIGALNIRAAGDVAPVAGGPKVTVFVPAYHAADRIGMALDGILSQDYQNLEVLVVDDASSDRTADVVGEVSSRDSRVRLVRVLTNGGAYRARNLGLREASGDLFVVNDADDWAHPQRIRTLVSLLIANPLAVAAQASLFRISPTLGIKPKVRGFAHPDTSSTMFWRAKVVSALGSYDESRFSADSEFVERLEMAFGKQAITRTTKSLLFSHWGASTLSGSLKTGISDGGLFAPVRARYRFEYRRRLSREKSAFRAMS